jgi:hypothetical protein
MLVTITPPGLENLFRAAGTKTTVPRGVVPEVPVPPTPAQLELFMKLMPSYGVSIAHPDKQSEL